MSLSFNKKSLMSTLLGASLVIGGVVIKNTLEQLKTPKHPLSKVGLGLFIIGWVIVAYATGNSGSKSRNKMFIAFSSAAGIVYSVMSMKKAMASGMPMPMMYPAIFAGSWLTLGYTVGMGKGGFFNTSTILGLLAAGMVLLGMMVVLPWQRKNKVVDGPGMPLFVAAWGLLAAGNALKSAGGNVFKSAGKVFK